MLLVLYINIKEKRSVDKKCLFFTPIKLQWHITLHE